jgi:hypothetical protein
MVGVGRACLVRFKRDSRGRLCLCLTLIRLVEEAVSLKGGRARCVSSAQSTVVFILSFPFATSRFSLSIAPVRRSITPLRCGLIPSFFLCFLALFSAALASSHRPSLLPAVKSFAFFPTTASLLLS